jgi:hypothetical protein
MSDQFLNGQAFALGDQVTATKLMDLVKKAQILTPAITSQTELTSGNVDVADQFLIYDSSAVALKKATVASVLKNIVTDSVTGPTTAALAVAGGAGQEVLITGDVVRTTSNFVASANCYLGGAAQVTEITGTTNTITGATSVVGALSVSGNVTASTVPTTANHLTNKTYVDGVNSIASNGYSKLPSGLIIQWGVTSASTAAARNVTFPLAFPTACLNLTGTATNPTAGNSSNYDYFAQVVSFTASAAVFQMQIAGAGSIQSSQIYWFAIGY